MFFGRGEEQASRRGETAGGNSKSFFFLATRKRKKKMWRGESKKKRGGRASRWKRRKITRLESRSHENHSQKKERGVSPSSKKKQEGKKEETKDLLFSISHFIEKRTAPSRDKLSSRIPIPLEQGRNPLFSRVSLEAREARLAPRATRQRGQQREELFLFSHNFFLSKRPKT